MPPPQKYLKIKASATQANSLTAAVFLQADVPVGYYYNENGKFLGIINPDGNDSAKNVFIIKIKDEGMFNVIKNKKTITESENEKIMAFTTLYGLNNDALLNRAHWVYGEGGGNFPDHYAHAIKNLKRHGPWGPAKRPFSTDEKMYEQCMKNQGGKNKIVKLYPHYFKGIDSGAPAEAFAEARKQPENLNDLEKANDAIKAVIGSITGDTTDPTDGCYQWAGAFGSVTKVSQNPEANNATGLVTLTAEGYCHTFYKILNE